MAPPVKRARFGSSPLRRSPRVPRRPDRYGYAEGVANANATGGVAPTGCLTAQQRRSSTTGEADRPGLTPVSKVTQTASCSDAGGQIVESTNLEELVDYSESWSKKQQCGLLDLPPDVLRFLFTKFTFQQVSQSLRPVCRLLHRETGRFLNSALLSLGARLGRGLRALEMQLTCAQDDVEWRAASRAYNALETVYAQYRLVEAVIWRWLSPRHIGVAAGRDIESAMVAATSAGCCYAGRFLDDLHQLATTAVMAPDNLVVAAIAQRGRVDAAINKFVNYFEKTAGGGAWRRSAQMVDLLDCLLAARYTAKREATESEAAAGICRLQGRYSLPRAWFTSLPLAGTTPTETSADDARLMALRLRRLVRSSNQHHLESIQRERESAALASSDESPLSSSLPTPASTYSGFGESGNRFYYYGSMNERAAKARERANNSDHAVTHTDPPALPNLQDAIGDDGDPDFEPPPRPDEPRDDQNADNRSESSAGEAAAADGADVDDARSDFDEDEIALLEADAARDVYDILADMERAQPGNEEADQMVLAEDPGDELPDVDDVADENAVEDFHWMDAVNVLGFDGQAPSDAELTALLDDDMNAEAESIGVPCPLTSNEAQPSDARVATPDVSAEEMQAEEQRFKELCEGADLLFDVDLTCPMELAPLAVCRKFEFATLEYEEKKLSRTQPSLAKYSSPPCKASTSRSSGNHCDDIEHVQEESESDDSYGFRIPFHLVLTIRCPTSARHRLPPICIYEAKSPTQPMATCGNASL